MGCRVSSFPGIPNCSAWDTAASAARSLVAAAWSHVCGLSLCVGSHVLVHVLVMWQPPGSQWMPFAPCAQSRFSLRAGRSVSMWLPSAVSCCIHVGHRAAWMAGGTKKGLVDIAENWIALQWTGCAAQGEADATGEDETEKDDEMLELLELPEQCKSLPRHGIRAGELEGDLPWQRVFDPALLLSRKHCVDGQKVSETLFPEAQGRCDSCYGL